MNRKHWSWILLSLLSAAGLWGGMSLAGPEVRPAGPVAKIVGLSIARPDPEDKTAKRSLATGLPAGVSIFFRAQDSQRQFIRIDRQASQFGSLKDDKGTTLFVPSSEAGAKSRWLAPQPRYGPDGHSVEFVLRGNVFPASGAKSIHAQATVVLLAGTELKTENHKDVLLEKGTPLSAGKAILTIEAIREEDQWGPDAKFQVHFSSPQSLDAIKSIAFLDTAGKEIPGKNLGSSVTLWSDGTKVHGLTWGLKSRPEKASVRIECFQNVIPIKLNINNDVSVSF